MCQNGMLSPPAASTYRYAQRSLPGSHGCSHLAEIQTRLWTLRRSQRSGFPHQLFPWPAHSTLSHLPLRRPEPPRLAGACAQIWLPGEAAICSQMSNLEGPNGWKCTFAPAGYQTKRSPPAAPPAPSVTHVGQRLAVTVAQARLPLEVFRMNTFPAWHTCPDQRAHQAGEATQIPDHRHSLPLFSLLHLSTRL